MMPDLGKYATEVLLAYGVSLTLLIVMVLALWWRSNRAKQMLKKAEDG